MAGFYSFGRLKIISRNGIKSSVATAAYHAAIKIENEYDGVIHDHRKKKDVGETFIRMPKSAPERWKDESVPAKERLGEIWNSIEKAHSADNARLARTNYIALPHSLTVEQGLECVDRFIKENCTEKGMGATYSLHLKPGNHHVDVMYFVSEYDKNGKPKEKSKKEYLCRSKAGEECYMDAETFKKSNGYEKVYKYQKDGERADMTPSEASEKDGWERINKYPLCRTIKVSGWDEPGITKKWRKSWEVILNEKFEELGMKDRVDCRSYKERGLEKAPTIHEGWGPDKQERHSYNEQVIEYNEGLENLYKDGIEALNGIVAQVRDLRDNQQTEESLRQHEEAYKPKEQILNKVVESGLYRRQITTKLSTELARLSRYMKELMEKWRTFLKQEIEGNRSLTEPSEKVEQSAGDMKLSISELMAEAAIERERSNAEKKKQRKDVEREGR